MNALEAINKEIDEKVAQLKDHLATGNVDSLEEYKRICGEMKGLTYVKEYVISLQKNIESYDE